MVIPLIDIDVDVDMMVYVHPLTKKYIEQSLAVQPLFKSV